MINQFPRLPIKNYWGIEKNNIRSAGKKRRIAPMQAKVLRIFNPQFGFVKPEIAKCS
jgi:hypothetical protein